jgi:hypothetical protein
MIGPCREAMIAASVVRTRLSVQRGGRRGHGRVTNALFGDAICKRSLIVSGRMFGE